MVILKPNQPPPLLEKHLSKEQSSLGIYGMILIIFKSFHSHLFICVLLSTIFHFQHVVCGLVKEDIKKKIVKF